MLRLSGNTGIGIPWSTGNVQFAWCLVRFNTDLTTTRAVITSRRNINAGQYNRVILRNGFLDHETHDGNNLGFYELPSISSWYLILTYQALVSTVYYKGCYARPVNGDGAGAVTAGGTGVLNHQMWFGSDLYSSTGHADMDVALLATNVGSGTGIVADPEVNARRFLGVMTPCISSGPTYFLPLLGETTAQWQKDLYTRTIGVTPSFYNSGSISVVEEQAPLPLRRSPRIVRGVV